MDNRDKTLFSVIREYFSDKRKPHRYYDPTPIQNRYNSDIQSMLGASQMTYNELVTTATDNNESEHVSRYREYEDMEKDTLIQSAIELYADDATSISSRSSNVITIVSKNDTSLATDISNMIRAVDLDSMIWNWAYQLCLYGDHYTRVLFTELEGQSENNADNYLPLIIDYDDPACIMDISEYGSRLLYIEDRSVHATSTRVDNSLSSQANTYDNSHNILQANELVHFMIKKSSNYSNISLVVNEERDEKGNPAIRDYQIIRGSSILDPIRYIYRTIRLLEDSLLAIRVSKSNYARVFNIEVQDSIPEATTKMINEVKNLFDSKANFNTLTGTYQSYKTNRPYMDPIFNPVRNGKGQIQIEEVGGEVDVTHIADIDYFVNKLHGGLKIPKAFLGNEESMSSGFSNDSLTRIDLRYSRSVTRVTKALISGITEIIDLWLTHIGRESSIGNYEVRIKSPNEAEILTDINNLSEIFNAISTVVETVSTTMGDYVNIPNLLNSLLSVYIPDEELLKLISKDLQLGIDKYSKEVTSIDEEGDDHSITS